jgi:hypothetical protein
VNSPTLTSMARSSLINENVPHELRCDSEKVSADQRLLNKPNVTFIKLNSSNQIEQSPNN